MSLLMSVQAVELQDEQSSIETSSECGSLFDEPIGGPELEMNFDTPSEDATWPHPEAEYVAPPPPTDIEPAQLVGPSIRGLYFDPKITLPEELASTIFQTCRDTYFRDEDVNQVMLFERVVSSPPGTASGTPSSDQSIDGASNVSPSTRLPQFLTALLDTLARRMRDALPTKTHELLFPPLGSPPRARQVIINYYRPGEGITPHVDLLDRFGDGILGVSLGSGCVMRFDKVVKDEERSRQALNGQQGEHAAIFLPPGSVYVMSEEARYDWTHGIDGLKEDWVQDGVETVQGRWIQRSMRISITFRWLLPGADIVGGLPDAVSTY